MKIIKETLTICAKIFIGKRVRINKSRSTSTTRKSGEISIKRRKTQNLRPESKIRTKTHIWHIPSIVVFELYSERCSIYKNENTTKTNLNKKVYSVFWNAFSKISKIT